MLSATSCERIQYLVDSMIDPPDNHQAEQQRTPGHPQRTRRPANLSLPPLDLPGQCVNRVLQAPGAFLKLHHRLQGTPFHE